jgi:C4-dicarboxylate-specific signal transduction histidine kinase
MIAWASSDELATSKVGSNFAYRDYFNGQADDADRDAPKSW